MGVGWVTAVREEGREVAVTGGGWVTAVWEEGRVLAVTGGLGGGGEGGRSGGGGEGVLGGGDEGGRLKACGDGGGWEVVVRDDGRGWWRGGWVRDHCSHSRACMHVHVRGMSA